MHSASVARPSRLRRPTSKLTTRVRILASVSSVQSLTTACSKPMAVFSYAVAIGRAGQRVGGAVHLPALDAATGEQHAEHTWPVVTPVG